MAKRAAEHQKRQQPVEIHVEIATETSGGRNGAIGTALATIVTYIPSEVVTLYVAATAALRATGEPSPASQWALLAVVLALTPVVVWATYAAMRRRRDDDLPWSPRTWPWPAIIVSTLGFLIWSFSLPDSPFGHLPWYQPAMASVVLLLGTTVLGLVAPLLPDS
jgi:hypothetical protein